MKQTLSVLISSQKLISAMPGIKLHLIYVSTIDNLLYIQVWRYCIAQKFGEKKLWRTWRFIANPSKFYLPKGCEVSWAQILNGFCLCNHQSFLRQFSCSSNSAKVFFRQSFVLYGRLFQALSRYIKGWYLFIDKLNGKISVASIMVAIWWGIH